MLRVSVLAVGILAASTTVTEAQVGGPAFAFSASPYSSAHVPGAGYQGYSVDAGYYPAAPAYGGPAAVAPTATFAAPRPPQWQSGYRSGSVYYGPGGLDARVGSPAYYYSGEYGVISGNPYNDHFGPGFQRHSLHGEYRFPNYDYRAPWYYPGRAVYQRDTNFAW